MVGQVDFNKAVRPLDGEPFVFETDEREALGYATAHESQAQAVIWRRGGFDDRLASAIEYCRDKPMHVDYVMNAALSLGLDYPDKFDPSEITPEFKRQAEVIAEDFASVDAIVESALVATGKSYKPESNIMTQLGVGEADYIFSNNFHDHQRGSVWSSTYWGEGLEFGSPSRALREEGYEKRLLSIEDESEEALAALDIRALNAGDVVFFHGKKSPYASSTIAAPFMHRGAWPIEGQTRLSAGTLYHNDPGVR